MLIMKIMKENNNEMCYMEEDEDDIFLKRVMWNGVVLTSV